MNDLWLTYDPWSKTRLSLLSVSVIGKEERKLHVTKMSSLLTPWDFSNKMGRVWQIWVKLLGVEQDSRDRPDSTPLLHKQIRGDDNPHYSPLELFMTFLSRLTLDFFLLSFSTLGRKIIFVSCLSRKPSRQVLSLKTSFLKVNGRNRHNYLSQESDSDTDIKVVSPLYFTYPQSLTISRTLNP